MASLVMAANMNNVGATTHNHPMHSCKVCNKELDNEKALWLHMRTHGIHHYYSNYHQARNPDQEPNMANCLVLLSNGTLKPLALVFTDSTSKRSQDGKPAGTGDLDPEPSIRVQDQSTELQGRGKFECKACNKVFTSHQALGGHRASHKKVKGCFAANVVASNLDIYENDENLPPVTATSNLENRVTPPKKPNKIHECSICHKVFPSGQALGGHKRCHWLPYTLPPPLPPHTTTGPPPPQTLKFHNFFDVDESQPFNMSANKKPRYTIISSPPDQNATPTVTFLGPLSKKTNTSNCFQSLHCSYKCNTTLSLFNDDEDLMPLKMQREGKSSSWLHLGFRSPSTSTSEETA